MTGVDDVIAYATQELGKPYVFGDEGPNTFDCSGLMQFIFAKVGIKLPRTAREQQDYAPRVSQPVPGDLIFWGDPAHHVALYIGGGKMISAPHRGAVVRVGNVYGTPTYGRVPGLGAALAVPIGMVQAAAGKGLDLVDDVLGGAKKIVYEGLFVGLGLVLVGVGLYRAAQSPRVKKTIDELRGSL